MTELSKTYSPKEVEEKWYDAWNDGGYFKPKKGKANESFCVIMPPPNVTGILHAGHALDVTTQDALIRFKRMKGYETLWLPGMDHAGIATQNVVEKKLWNEEKKTRHDYKREEFIDQIWEWKEKHGGIIFNQQKSLGASPDWNYSTFTMDQEPHEAVNKVFVDLYNEGLIYQSDYIVNWDPGLQSAISDAEVEHKEVEGAFYHLLYKVKDSDETLEIATTRPETLLGDTAVCVHPDDERFSHLVGKTAIVPLCNREVTIIADDYVDIEKGTGCLKVTPGHDFNDFEIGKRHNLEIIKILNKDATFNDYGLEWKGLHVKEARKKIVQKLDELGILKETKKHVHQVGHGDRSKAIIEPMVSKQWFLNTEKMSAEAVKAVENDDTKFFPKGWENTYFSWLRNPRNWCISRQLWWGHQIPVFYCGDCDHRWAHEQKQSECEKCNSKNVSQDPDVLDTWFSSALWPMSTLGWPNKERMKEKGYDTFFPTATLITGFDIIFFWVARMMMMSLKFTGEVPFKHVYIHAIVRDKQGRKMSKSLGNGIDPLDMVEEYGADAFRFTLAAGSGYNRNLNLDPERIGGYRNFINKLWNAFRFIAPHLEEARTELPEHKDLDIEEKWILSELNKVTKEMNSSMNEYRYDDSCSAIYQFVYEKYCSWFVELSKNILYGEDTEKKNQRATVLKHTLKKMLALLHPVAPYITEEIWSNLKTDCEDLLIVTEYPEYDSKLEFKKEQDLMNKYTETVTAIRNLRANIGLKPKEKIAVSVYLDEKDFAEFLEQSSVGLADLAKVKEIKTYSKTESRPERSVMSATSYSEIYLLLDASIDLTEQKARLNKELEKTKKDFEKLSKKLSNEKFMGNAPEEIVLKVKTEAKEFEEKILAIESRLNLFN